MNHTGNGIRRDYHAPERPQCHAAQAIGMLAMLGILALLLTFIANTSHLVLR